MDSPKHSTAVPGRDLEKITQFQREMHARFNQVPQEGSVVEYGGETFVVLPSVFWPFEDSRPLAENFVIHPGESVLDVGTGSGLLGILSLKKGAASVVAVDSNPMAVKNAKLNAARHGFAAVMDVRLSDIFTALGVEERFDVILANLPFRNLPTKDGNPAETATWDDGLKANRAFFQNVTKHLKSHGRIYFSQANFGAVDELLKLAQAQDLTVRLIGTRPLPNDPRIFYAFEFRKADALFRS